MQFHCEHRTFVLLRAVTRANVKLAVDSRLAACQTKMSCFCSPKHVKYDKIWVWWVWSCLKASFTELVAQSLKVTAAKPELFYRKKYVATVTGALWLALSPH